VTIPAVTPPEAVAAEPRVPAPPPAQPVPPANQALSTVVSYGLVSYFSRTPVDMADPTQSAGCAEPVQEAAPSFALCGMLGKAIRTGDKTMSTGIERALAQQLVSPPYGLMGPRARTSVQLLQAQQRGLAPSGSAGTQGSVGECRRRPLGALSHRP